jgi:hypothetical protein
MASRIKRSVPVTISEVLDGHTELDLECLDRVHQGRARRGPLADRRKNLGQCQ